MEGCGMKTFEFTERAGDDLLVRLNIPVETAGMPYHVVVHLEPASGPEPAEFLSDEFINETAGRWTGEFVIGPEGEYEEREPL
jgi:hypothetical protein